MLLNLEPRPNAVSHTMSPRETDLVLANARSLQRAAQSGTSVPLLRGKNVALICESRDDPRAMFFADAASALGAQVSHIRSSQSKLATPAEVRHTARMLGRLYDAIECHGLAPEIVQQIGSDAGVPVYEGLAFESHPTATLAGQLGGDGTLSEHRRYVLQAVLLTTIG